MNDKELKTQVLDHLNQLSILLKDTEMQYEDEFDGEKWTSNPKYSEENKFLVTTRGAVRALLNSQDGSIDDSLDYFSSGSY